MFQLGDDGFHEKDGAAYCKDCYFGQFAPKCGGCNLPITENYISALNKQVGLRVSLRRQNLQLFYFICSGIQAVLCARSVRSHSMMDHSMNMMVSHTVRTTIMLSEAASVLDVINLFRYIHDVFLKPKIREMFYFRGDA